jgi:hypothetical protein
MEPSGRATEKNTELADPSPPPSPSLDEKGRDAKASQILDACRRRDVETLRVLSTSEGGLVSDEVRRQACQLPPRVPCPPRTDTI